jgi:hypothetical protein
MVFEKKIIEGGYMIPKNTWTTWTVVRLINQGLQLRNFSPLGTTWTTLCRA